MLKASRSFSGFRCRQSSPDAPQNRIKMLLKVIGLRFKSSTLKPKKKAEKVSKREIHSARRAMYNVL